MWQSAYYKNTLKPFIFHTWSAVSPIIYMATINIICSLLSTNHSVYHQYMCSSVMTSDSRSMAFFGSTPSTSMRYLRANSKSFVVQETDGTNCCLRWSSRRLYLPTDEIASTIEPVGTMDSDQLICKEMPFALELVIASISFDNFSSQTERPK